MRTVKRWDKINKKYVIIEQPEIIDRYNNGMGGVDLLDQLLSYYRIFLKSKKWTLRVIFHFVDLAVCASFIEYKKECTHLNIPEPKQMKLLDFKLSLGQVLTLVNTSMKRNHVAADNVNERLKSEIRPSKEVRFDTVLHFPQHDQKDNATRCKLLGCTSKSRIFCNKCDVHLCLNKTKNCFITFHSVRGRNH